MVLPDWHVYSALARHSAGINGYSIVGTVFCRIDDYSNVGTTGIDGYSIVDTVFRRVAHLPSTGLPLVGFQLLNLAVNSASIAFSWIIAI